MELVPRFGEIDNLLAIGADVFGKEKEIQTVGWILCATEQVTFWSMHYQ